MVVTPVELREKRVRISVTRRRFVALRWLAALEKRPMADLVEERLEALFDDAVARYDAAHPPTN